MSARLILTIGLPGSGKSYWAAQQDAVVVNRDEIRFQLTGDERNHNHEMEVTDIGYMRVREGLRAGKTVIVSDTNLKAKYRRNWRTIAQQENAVYEEKSFLDVPVELCIERDAQRTSPVGEEIIRRMNERKS